MKTLPKSTKYQVICNINIADRNKLSFVLDNPYLSSSTKGLHRWENIEEITSSILQNRFENLPLEEVQWTAYPIGFQRKKKTPLPHWLHRLEGQIESIQQGQTESQLTAFEIRKVLDFLSEKKIPKEHFEHCCIICVLLNKHYNKERAHHFLTLEELKQHLPILDIYSSIEHLHKLKLIDSNIRVIQPTDTFWLIGSREQEVSKIDMFIPLTEKQPSNRQKEQETAREYQKFALKFIQEFSENFPELSASWEQYLMKSLHFEMSDSK